MLKRRQSVFLDDDLSILSDKIEKPYRLTPFIVTFSGDLVLDLKTENFYFLSRLSYDEIVINSPAKLCQTIQHCSTGTISAIDIRQLIELGLQIIRFKMSNVTRRDKIKLLAMLKIAVSYCCEKFEVSTWPIAISIDLPHSCIRTGRLSKVFDEEHYLTKSNIVEITSNNLYCDSCSNSRIYIDDPDVLRGVTEGTEVTLSNGNICLVCIAVVDYQTIKCKVLKGGQLDNKDDVCFRGVKRETSVDLSKIDLEFIEFAKEFNLDIITIKVVHSPITLRKVKALFEGREVPLLMSAICDQEGIDNADAIIEESDGIIFAREFLAYQISDIYKMPTIQLQIGAKCRQLGKPFYISGNILERTLLEGKVSHGDLSDITNAVSNRAGFVLQNYNDASNLLQAVKILDSVCRSVESRTRDIEFWTASSEMRIPVNAAEACVLGCALAARQVRALVIILPTVTGRTAFQLTRIATDKIILTISSNSSVARKLRFRYGIIPIIYDKKTKKDWQAEMAARIKFAVTYGIKQKFLKYGSAYVVLRKLNPKSAFADVTNIMTASIEDIEQDRNCPES